ncbi:DUF4388 domain-containing protein [bacterium]|nr:DUF4388 domain-containing protein [bacterium]
MAFEGELQNFSLPDILQMLQMGKRTGALSIRHREEIGTLYFRKGELVHATYKNMTGEDAAYNLLNWKTGRFRFDTTIYPTRRSIKISTTNLILEAARRSDELADLQTELPPPDTVLHFANIAGRVGDIHLSPDEWKVLSLVDGRRSIADICSDSEIDEVSTLQIIEQLLGIGLLQQLTGGSPSLEDEGPPATSAEWEQPPM